MRFGSVCSGIEAASAAWEPLGWQAAFYSEIEPFPSAVLHEHYSSGRPQFMPDPEQPGLQPKDRKARAAAIKAVKSLPERANGVPNHGDMTQFEEWPDHAIDLLVGGTPCQTYSIAGLRKGLDDPRGDLMLTYAAIARRYRPRWLVWENVFGVLSHDGGRSFASLLGLLSGRRVEVPAGGWKSSGIVEGYSGAYGLSWRVLDTQYVRVDGASRALPQRRRRVFVVGHSGGDWRRAAAVLFEREGLSGNPAPRHEPGKRDAPSVSTGARGSGDFELGGGLNAVHVDEAARCDTAGYAQRLDWETENFVAHVAPTMRAGGNQTGGDRPYGTDVDTCDSLVAHTLLGKENDSHAADMDTYVSHSLRPEGFDASEDGTGRGTPIVPIACSIMPQNSGKDYKARKVDVAQPVMAGGPVGGNQGGDYILDPVAFSSKDHGADASVGVSPTLRAMGHGESHPNAGGQVAIAFDTTQITSNANRSNPKEGDPCHPLASGAHAPAIAIQAGALRENPASGPDGVGVQEGIAYTIEARSEVQAIQTQWAVRRLTPVECARLQGFPDNHCKIPWRGKPAEQCPDGPQYKAYGNSMSTNVMRWLGERIEAVDHIQWEFAA
ncbi:DNA cytosine methyltransferase [Phyllobacterium phragmitis]|nr:DNA cytosine methyltransferase [Phyllobacterium phragmitis]